MSEDPMVEEFFSELNDKYYPQVMTGLEMLEGDALGEGIEILARPLHTIKGVTGFMTGFEEASHFTHKIEDFLKKVQSGDVESSPENVTLLSRGVNMIFQVLEQLRDGDMDEEEKSEVLGLIDEASKSDLEESEISGAGVDVDMRDNVTIIRVKDPRVHLEGQFKPIISAILCIEPGGFHPARPGKGPDFRFRGLGRRGFDGHHLQDRRMQSVRRIPDEPLRLGLRPDHIRLHRRRNIFFHSLRGRHARQHHSVH